MNDKENSTLSKLMGISTSGIKAKEMEHFMEGKNNPTLTNQESEKRANNPKNTGQSPSDKKSIQAQRGTWEMSPQDKELVYCTLCS